MDCIPFNINIPNFGNNIPRDAKKRTYPNRYTRQNLSLINSKGRGLVLATVHRVRLGLWVICVSFMVQDSSSVSTQSPILGRCVIRRVPLLTVIISLPKRTATSANKAMSRPDPFH